MAQQVDIVKNEVELVDAINNPVTVTHNSENGRYSLVTNIDESQCSFSEEYSSDQTNLVIITPPAGGSLHIHGVYCSTVGSAGEIQLDFLTSGKHVFRLYITKTTSSAMSTLNIFGEINESLTLNTTAGAGENVFIIVNYMCI